jgi:L-threonylcarbamoyladenylate synthase
MPILAPTPQSIALAARAILAGRPVAMPTETVYGLAANAEDDAAVAKVFEIKGRPSFNPLICHVVDRTWLDGIVMADLRAARLVERFWPGPLTLVLPRVSGSRISLLATAGLDTVAVRSPAHPVAQALLREVGVPLAAPSANRSGRISPTTPADVETDLGDTVDVLDGGPCRVGVESTVLDLSASTPRILRHGGVTMEQLREVLGTVKPATGGAVVAPGMMASHYAPLRPVRLEATAARGNEALLAFGATVPSGFHRQLNLSPKGDLGEAAANLFRFMRQLDTDAVERIAVMPIPEQGLGRAINDRLRRAAVPRPDEVAETPE